MEQKNENGTAAEKARAAAEARAAEGKRHLIFGIIATVVIAGLIALMFAIEQYGESKMPNAQVQTHDSAER